MDKTIICDWACACAFCPAGIKKGDRYFRLDKSGWKSSVRINICKNCISEIYDDFYGDVERLMIQTKRLEEKQK
jgi:hypothetical protein